MTASQPWSVALSAFSPGKHAGSGLSGSSGTTPQAPLQDDNLLLARSELARRDRGVRRWDRIGGSGTPVAAVGDRPVELRVGQDRHGGPADRNGRVALRRREVDISGRPGQVAGAICVEVLVRADEHTSVAVPLALVSVALGRTPVGIS